MAFSSQIGTVSPFTHPGTSSFGTSTATTAQSGNRGFGTSAGFSFNNPTTSGPMFNLGGTTTTGSGFGFGGLTSSAPATSGFGFPSAFGTSTAATTTGTSAGFGGFPSFGATTSAGTAPFGGTAFGTQPGGTLFSGIGQTSTAGTVGFGGSTFGGFAPKPATTAPGSFGFGGGTGGSLFLPGLTQQQQQQQQQQQINPNEALYSSLFCCNVYGDERDAILQKWNVLQAMWGVGKGYYAQNAPPVVYTQENPFCRFKAIGYSCMPSTGNADGLVTLTFNKKEMEIKNQQQQLITTLSSILGNKPNLNVVIEGIKPASENKTQVIFYVQEKPQTGIVRRVPALEISNFLLSPMQKMSMMNLGAENIHPHLSPGKEQLKLYLDNPPAGIDPRLWKQAQLDNLDPEKFIPVPMVGFGEVRWRMKCQEQETRLHQAFLDKVAQEIAELQRRHSISVAKITEYRRKFIELEHRILQVLVKQEISRKAGLTLQPEEEMLRGQLENLQAQLNVPAQFKGRLIELLSQVRMQSNKTTPQNYERYTMDDTVQEDIKQFLVSEQIGMSSVVKTIQDDLTDLKTIKEGMLQLLQGH